MPRILITGGAGFIGSHLARKLLDRGDQVTILDDFNDRYDPRLKEARIQNLFSPTSPPTLVRGDIRDLSLVKRVFTDFKPEVVVHLAAWAAVQTSIERPHIYTSVNVDGTVNVLEAARENHISNFVFASSSSVYGGRNQVPFKESDDISRPISPYSATKVAGEALCHTWHAVHGLPVTCLRFFTVYGPWGRPEMAIFKFSEAILSGQAVPMRGSKTIRDFTYIDDCLKGIIAAVDRPQGFAIYNLGESDGVPLPRLIKAMENALGAKAMINIVPLPPGDVPATLADITQARQFLGYNPVTKIEDGIKHFARWYRAWYLPHFLPSLK